ncbi:hypothetical protein RUND412_000071 [Rhizina undulata]
MKDQVGPSGCSNSSTAEFSQRTQDELYLSSDLAGIELFAYAPPDFAMVGEQRQQLDPPPLSSMMHFCGSSTDSCGGHSPGLNFTYPPLRNPAHAISATSHMATHSLEARIRSMIISNQHQREPHSQIVDQVPNSNLPLLGGQYQIPEQMPYNRPPNVPHPSPGFEVAPKGSSNILLPQQSPTSRPSYADPCRGNASSPSTSTHLPLMPHYFQQQYSVSQSAEIASPVPYPNQNAQATFFTPPQYSSLSSPPDKTGSSLGPPPQKTLRKNSEEHVTNSSVQGQTLPQQGQRRLSTNTARSQNMQTTPNAHQYDSQSQLLAMTTKNPILSSNHGRDYSNRDRDSHSNSRAQEHKRNIQSSESMEQIAKEQNMNLCELAQKVIADVAPPKSEILAKHKFLERLEEICKRVCPDAELISFGSFVTGFATTLSDLDVVFTAKSRINPEISVAPTGESSSSDPDFTIPRLLGKELLSAGLDVQLITKTRVPIVKIVQPPTKDCPYALHCDMGFSNYLALYNTQLLLSYSRCDERVKDMVIFIKWWAKKRRINNPYRGTLSSYGYALMILHYLINVVRPPVLENLQLISAPDDVDVAELFDKHGEGEHRIWFHKDIGTVQKSSNTMHLGNLLRGFFEYYTYGFQWIHEVISIRSKDGILTKRQKGWIAAVTRPGVTVEHEVKDRYLFAIEDPFEIEHNVSRTCNRPGVRKIREELKRAVSLIGYGDGGKAVTEYLCMEAPEERPWFRKQHGNWNEKEGGIGYNQRDQENVEGAKANPSLGARGG